MKRVDLGPHKGRPVVAVYKGKKAKYYSRRSYQIWVLLTFVIGLSITSFVYSGVEKVVVAAKPYVLKMTGNEPTPFTGIIAVTSTSTESTNRGSDDHDEENAIGTALSNDTVYTATSPNKNLKLSAKAYLVGDIATGNVIVSKQATSTYPFASVTKLMTALVSKSVDDLHSSTIISKKAVSTFGTTGDLKTGEQIVVGDLIYPLLLVSSNDAAEALAEHYGREEFLRLMNQKAASIGMFSTWYEDPSGLSAKNVTTASDLFKLTRHIYNVMPEIYDTTRVRSYQILRHSWNNANHFIALDSFVGGKNGFTDEARRTTASLFSVPIKNTKGVSEKRTIAIIILQSENREADVQAVLNYIKHYVSADNKSATSTFPTSR